MQDDFMCKHNKDSAKISVASNSQKSMTVEIKL